MKSEDVRVDSGSRLVSDITDAVEEFVRGEGGGLLNVFAPHATAGVALMETGSGSERDLEATFEQLLPRDDRYTHRHGSRGHGRDHLLPVIVSPSIVIPVRNGRVALGTWQRVVLIDPNVDNPRRTVRLTLISG